MDAEVNANTSKGDLPSYVRRSFKNGSLKQVRLPAGMLLFTVSRKPNFNANTADGVPSFWSPYKKYKSDPGFDARVDAAKKGASGAARDIFSDLSAFFGKHPGGRYAIVGKLKRPAYAFFGPIRRQNKSAAQISAATSDGNAGGASANTAPGAATSAANLIGFQFYIPGLDGERDIVRVKKHDLMNL